MRVHLLRHADAENFVTSDASRALTEKGLVQASRVGEFFVRSGCLLDLILTSPYQRALQTARAVAAKFSDVPLVEERRLGCGLSAMTGLKLLEEHRECREIVLVGHQPDLGNFAAYLLSPDGRVNVEFKKATVLTLSLPELEFGAGILESLVTVHQMDPTATA